MSPKGGKSVEFGSGREVFAVDRSIVKKAKSDIDSAAQHIKVITTPADELIDLRPLIKGDAKTTDELFKGANRSEMTEVQYRQQVRPKEQGLLMLYALNPNEGISDSDYQKIWLNNAEGPHFFDRRIFHIQNVIERFVRSLKN